MDMLLLVVGIVLMVIGLFIGMCNATDDDTVVKFLTLVLTIFGGGLLACEKWFDLEDPWGRPRLQETMEEFGVYEVVQTLEDHEKHFALVKHQDGDVFLYEMREQYAQGTYKVYKGEEKDVRALNGVRKVKKLQALTLPQLSPQPATQPSTQPILSP